MKPKRIRYYTMNSWNLSTAPAYNLKVYQVIPHALQDKVFEMMKCENFYDDINFLIQDFDADNDYKWQAGFNGRSGGYLVLYKGEKKPSQHKSICSNCGQRNFTSVKETGEKCGRCGKNTRHDREMTTISIFPGQAIEDNEVPKDVMKRFTQLANDIVNTVISNAKSCKVEDEEYIVTKTRKVLSIA